MAKSELENSAGIPKYNGQSPEVNTRRSNKKGLWEHPETKQQVILTRTVQADAFKRLGFIYKGAAPSKVEQHSRAQDATVQSDTEEALKAQLAAAEKARKAAEKRAENAEKKVEHAEQKLKEASNETAAPTDEQGTSTADGIDPPASTDDNTNTREGDK